MLKCYKIMILHDRGGWNGSVKIPVFALHATVLAFALMVGGMAYWLHLYQEMEGEYEDPTVYDELYLQQRDSLFELAFRIEAMEHVSEDIGAMNDKLKIMLAMSEDTWQDSLANGDLQARYHLSALAVISNRNLVREMHQSLDGLSTNLHAEEITQHRIMTALDIQDDMFTRIPSIWPCRGRLSSNFGYRNSPFTGKRDFHKGIDVTAPTGTEIWAPASGRVTYAGRFTSYGIIVELTHGNGIMTRFAHMSRVAVEEGDWVERDDVIGYVGNTGRSVAPHLHYEVHVKGTVTNPMNYILN